MLQYKKQQIYQTQKIRDKSLIKYGWILFLSISPIYFLPIIPIVILASFKWMLFFLLISFSLFKNYGNSFSIPYGRLGIFFITIFLISIYFGIFNTMSLQPASSRDHLFAIFNNPLFIFKEYLPQIAIFLVFYNYTKSDPNFYKILYYSGFFFSLFVFYVLLSSFFSFLDFTNPFYTQVFGERLRAIEGGFFISTTGFNAVPTNWNHAIAIFFPFIIFAYFKLFNKSFFLFLLISFLLLYSMSETAGRTGLVTAIIVLLIFLFMFFNFKKSLFMLALIALSFVVFNSYFLDKFKYSEKHRLMDEDNIFKNENFFSYRLISLLGAYKLIKDKPLGGYGHNKNFRKQMVWHQDQDWKGLKLPIPKGSQLNTVHNEFLRLYLTAGIFTFLFLILFLTLYIFKAFKISALFNNEEVSNFRLFSSKHFWICDLF